MASLSLIPFFLEADAAAEIGWRTTDDGFWMGGWDATGAEGVFGSSLDLVRGCFYYSTFCTLPYFGLAAEATTSAPSPAGAAGAGAATGAPLAGAAAGLGFSRPIAIGAS